MFQLARREKKSFEPNAICVFPKLSGLGHSKPTVAHYIVLDFAMNNFFRD